jgi:FtsH-binding integral membrane protein
MMGKKNFTALIIFIALLAVSILLMGVSLLLSERAFARVSSYIAIACVVITLIGVVFVIVRNIRNKGKDEFDELEESIERKLSEDKESK